MRRRGGKDFQGIVLKRQMSQSKVQVHILPSPPSFVVCQHNSVIAQ